MDKKKTDKKDGKLFQNTEGFWCFYGAVEQRLCGVGKPTPLHPLVGPLPVFNPIRAKPYFQATFEFWFLGLSNR